MHAELSSVKDMAKSDVFPWARLFCSIICAGAFVSDRSYDLAQLSDFFVRMYGNGALGFVVAIALYTLFTASSLVKLDKRTSRCLIVVAFVFALAETIGFNIDRYSSLLNPNANLRLGVCDLIGLFFCYFVMFSACLRVILNLLSKFSLKRTRVLSSLLLYQRWFCKHPVGGYFVCVAALLLAWLPYFFLLDPGVVTQDTYDEINQAVGNTALNDHHPIAYTAFLKLTLHFGVLLMGNIGGGVVVCSLVQMTLLALILALAITLIDIEPCYGWLLRIACLVFFALNPLIGWYSVTLWKDILFSAFVLLFCSSLIAIVMTKSDSISAWKYFVFFFAALGMLFLKKTGIYLALPTMIALVLVMPNFRKRLALICSAVIVCYVVLHSAFINVLGVTEGDSREALSIPLQQVARVVANDPNCLSSSDKQAVSAVLPLEEVSSLYYPKVSDNIKNQFNTDAFKNDAMSYVQLYSKLGFTHPMEYLEAFLSGTSGYWYPETKYWSVSGSDYQYVLATNIDYGEETFDDIGQYAPSKIESPERLQAIEFITGMKNIPILSVFLSISLWVWIYFAVFCFMPRHTKVKLAPIIFLIVMAWITCLISPVYAETRYAYPLVLMLPLVCGVVAMVMRNDNKNQ